jgi:uncharacterized protein (TIGR02452 family)
MQHQNYFSRKEKNSLYAQQWVQNMQDKYSTEIDNSIRKSAIYHDGNILPVIKLPSDAKHTVTVEVLPLDTVSGIYKLSKSTSPNGKLCALNFASYKNPGGMFLKGSSAQEESLCKESTLYNVLSSDQLVPYYEYNKKHLNNSLYTNRAIYSPNILFRRKYEKGFKDIYCDVLTCAAPNLNPAYRYKSKEEINTILLQNTFVLANRIKFILDVMNANKVTNPILGAFGCGVFKQSAEEVANAFMNMLVTYDYGFEKVTFCILPGPNFDAFKKVVYDYFERYEDVNIAMY